MTRDERRLMWQERVDQYRASGMSVAAWCRENVIAGVKWDTTAGAKIPNIADKKNPHL